MNDQDLRAALKAITTVLSPDQTTALDPVIEPTNTQGAVAVAPRNLAEIAAVFDLCNRTTTPLIPHGGRTGLAGAVCANGSEVMLLGTQMPRFIDVDAVSQSPIEKESSATSGLWFNASVNRMEDHMPWNDTARDQHTRDHLRYPGDLTDHAWALIAPMLPAATRAFISVISVSANVIPQANLAQDPPAPHARFPPPAPPA